MSSRTLQLSDAIQSYLWNRTVREPDVLRELREETMRLPRAEMQISPEQGQFMRLLVELLGVRHALEIGTFTGYSALCVALALPADGRLVCCDISREWTAVARRFWRKAGVADKIDLRIGPALATLDALAAEHAAAQSTASVAAARAPAVAQTGPAGRVHTAFDFAFIDADRANVREYYERALPLLRPGGLLCVDNALRGGQVADPSVTDPDTAALRDLTAHVYGDERVSMSVVPIGDGLLMARKRG